MKVPLSFESLFYSCSYRGLLIESADYSLYMHKQEQKKQNGALIVTKVPVWSFRKSSHDPHFTGEEDHRILSQKILLLAEGLIPNFSGDTGVDA